MKKQAILSMNAADIESHMRELYDIDISYSTVSRITDKILPIVREWQDRLLEEIYAVVFMDAIHYHVRSERKIVKRAVYIDLGIDMKSRARKSTSARCLCGLEKNSAAR